MKVVISGNGLGSRVLSLFLAQRPDLFQSVTIIEKSKFEIEAAKDSFIGLWGPSLHILRHLDIWKDLSHSKSVIETSYRTVDGIRIAKPRRNLCHPDDKNGNRSLTFVNRFELLNALDKKMATLEPENLNIIYDNHITSISNAKDRSDLEVRLTSGESLQAGLLVGADGSHSGVRRLVLPNMQPLSFRGYKVYRGHSSSSISSSNINSSSSSGSHSHSVPMYHTLSGVVEEGFQTWGIGKRFACVPTHLGNSWFAAISCHPPMSLHHEAPWGDRGGALLNGSFSVTAEEFEKIRGPLLEWHSPIPQLLNNTDSSSVTCTYAYATPEPVAGGYTRMFKGGGVTFIGDAAHTLDPILAQGAGVAVEEAALLASCLTRNDTSILLSDRLKEYEVLRAGRIKTLHRLSNWSQSIGHVSTKGIARIRDNMFSLINSTYPTRVVAEMAFDKMVDTAVESEVFKTFK